MADSLRSFWSYTIDDKAELMLQQPTNYDSVITQVSLAEPEKINSRVTLTAFVETLLMDKPKVDNEFQAVNYETVIASFCPNDQPTKFVNVGFTSTDITYVIANGGKLIVSGYVMPSKVKFSQFQTEE